MINQRYQALDILSKKQRRLLPYFGFPIQTLYLGFLNDQPTEKKVLDIGCGNGFLLRHLNYWNNQAYGIDGSEPLVKRLNSLGLDSVKHCMFPKSLIDLDESYDWIYCLDVIEHVEDRDLFIQGLLKLKTKQNNMVLIFPNQKHHGQDGLISVDEFSCLSNIYEFELVKLIPPYWFTLIQAIKSSLKKVLAYKEGDLFHENPSYTHISNHPHSWVLSRIIEVYFRLFTLFPPKIDKVDHIDDEGVYMMYFGQEL